MKLLYLRPALQIVEIRTEKCVAVISTGIPGVNDNPNSGSGAGTGIPGVGDNPNVAPQKCMPWLNDMD